MQSTFISDITERTTADATGSMTSAAATSVMVGDNIKKHTIIFVIAQDFGHFGYTVHLARELRSKYNCNIEYWSHKSAEKQCPSFAHFHWLTDDQRMIQFYCKHASRFDTDKANIEYFSGNINALMAQEFPVGSIDSSAHSIDSSSSSSSRCPDGPLVTMAGEKSRVMELKRRLLQPDVLMCVNDQCHVFSWAGEHCELYGVPVLNLYPSQHQLQRQAAGLWNQWQTIFSNIDASSDTSKSKMTGVRTSGTDDMSSIEKEQEDAIPAGDVIPAAEVYTAVRANTAAVPRVPGLYITYPPLISAEARAFIPEGRKILGPIYVPSTVQQQEELDQNWTNSDLYRWLNASEEPVVYVSLGSMVKGQFLKGDENVARGVTTTTTGVMNNNNSNRNFADILLGALYKHPGCRILTTIQPNLLSSLFPTHTTNSKLYFALWTPQFSVLKHSAVRCFITHGGANSIHESIFHAVPMIVVPFFDDQRYNGPRLVELGLASACLNKMTLTETEVLTAVKCILGEPIVSNTTANTTANTTTTVSNITDSVGAEQSQHQPCVKSLTVAPTATATTSVEEYFRMNLVAVSDIARNINGLSLLLTEASVLCDFSLANPPIC